MELSTLNVIVFLAIIIVLGATFLGLQNQFTKPLNASRSSPKVNQQPKKKNAATEKNTKESKKQNQDKEKKVRGRDKVKPVAVQEPKIEDADRELLTLAKDALTTKSAPTTTQEQPKKQQQQQKGAPTKGSKGSKVAEQQQQEEEEGGKVDWNTVKKGESEGYKKRISELEDELRASKRLAEKYNDLLKDQREKSNLTHKEKKLLESQLASLRSVVQRGGNTKTAEGQLNYTQKPKVQQQQQQPSNTSEEEKQEVEEVIINI